MKNGFESLGRVRLQGIALLGVAFVVGALGGMALERVRASRVVPPAPPEWVGMRGGLPLGLERLDLTAAQRAEIETILRSSRPRTDSVLQASLPRLEAIRDSVRAQIRTVLTPEQRDRLDEMEVRAPRGPRGPRGAPGAGGGRPGGPPRDGSPR